MDHAIGQRSNDSFRERVECQEVAVRWYRPFPNNLKKLPREPFSSTRPAQQVLERINSAPRKKHSKIIN
jgi:hypothetical protein